MLLLCDTADDMLTSRLATTISAHQAPADHALYGSLPCASNQAAALLCCLQSQTITACANFVVHCLLGRCGCCCSAAWTMTAW